MDAESDAALRAQIAALTAAVAALTAASPAVRTVAEDITVDELATRYEKHVGKKILKNVSRAREHFKGRLVSTLRKAEYLTYRDDVRATKDTVMRRPPAVGTLNQELTIWLAMFRHGVKYDLIAANPFEGIPKLKGQRIRETEIEPEADRKAFACAPLLLRAFHETCAETGARNGCEVRMLERSHIDRAASMIRFWRVNTKGKVMTRDVPVSAALLELLAQLPVVLDSPYVFANPQTKRPYSHEHLNKLARPFLDMIPCAPGDVKTRTHDRRHTRVSKLARAGMNPMASMKLIGHKTASMHWRYLHVSDEDRSTMRTILETERKSRKSNETSHIVVATTPKGRAGHT